MDAFFPLARQRRMTSIVAIAPLAVVFLLLVFPAWNG